MSAAAPYTPPSLMFATPVSQLNPEQPTGDSAAPKKKSKSDAQKAREKKKLKKRNKLQQAKKAAAPKHKEWKPDPIVEALKRATQTQGERPQAEAKKSEMDAKDEGSEDDDGKSKRKAEKKEKREKRERKEARRLVREGTPDSAPAAEGLPMVIDAEQAEHIAGEVSVKGSASSAPSQRSPSPPPLEAFPLPRSAPAPDAAVLARQGLPKGLEDATFVDQTLRVGLDELRVPGLKKGALSEKMKMRLRATGVEELFAVQAAIIPHLLPLRLVPLPYSNLSDYLISAPTGSGKTLAYAVPILEILSQRVVTKLRALIVLPTRDLVAQVKETMEAVAKGTGLTIGAVTGLHPFAQEQSQLVTDVDTPLLGGSSKLDILIATPGRLMDHLASTPNFTLQHLRFLVIDEADRLLSQSFQNWLAQVLSYTRPPPASSPVSSTIIADTRHHFDKVVPAWMEAHRLVDNSPEWSAPVPSNCQKLLFSATLTRDPSKVAALALHHPQYFIVQSSSLPAEPTYIGEHFALPSSLSEKMLILPPALKPLNLIHLIHHPDYHVDSALVFTKSVESALRLVKLIEFFEDAYLLGGGGGKRMVVKSYTGEIKAAERKRLLLDFAEGKINLIVCSDLIARGMDLPAVSHVVSYDIPLDMRKYVHRVGRTARAGREGTAWALVEKQEALHFKGMMKSAGHLKQIKKIKVKEDDLLGYRESYEIAVSRMKEYFGHDT
ncbi:hypothetical protein IAT38_008287 [Cryptococcus sp. DSM 104549]